MSESHGGESAAAVTVLLHCEDALLRHALKGLLEEDGCRVVAEADSSETALAQVTDVAPDVVVMAAGGRSATGVELARRLLETGERVKVLALIDAADPAAVEAVIEAGACGCILKDDSSPEIVAAIRAAADGGSPISPRVAAVLLDRLRDRRRDDAEAPQLTARELHVLELVAAGRRNSQIAADLSISVYTVKRHVSHLLVKLGADNRTQAAVEATRRGLL